MTQSSEVGQRSESKTASLAPSSDHSEFFLTVFFLLSSSVRCVCVCVHLVCDSQNMLYKHRSPDVHQVCTVKRRDSQTDTTTAADQHDDPEKQCPGVVPSCERDAPHWIRDDLHSRNRSIARASIAGHYIQVAAPSAHCIFATHAHLRWHDLLQESHLHQCSCRSVYSDEPAKYHLS